MSIDYFAFQIASGDAEHQGRLGLGFRYATFINSSKPRHV
jgi:hypothetical protein